MSLNPKKRWVAHGSSWERYEDLLIGDREDLLALRQAIDEAVANGEGSLKDCGTEFSAVKVVEEYPDDVRTPMSLRGRLSAFAFLLVFLFLIVCCIYGCIRLPQLFK